jgi:hypothetical protein
VAFQPTARENRAGKARDGTRSKHVLLDPAKVRRFAPIAVVRKLNVVEYVLA